MEYAIENSPVIKQRAYEADNYRANYMAALGAFLPGISADAGTQFGFGRNINPDDNTIKNVSSFNNVYGVSAGVYLFRSGQLINQWKQARVDKLLGKNNEQLAKDELSIEVMEAYINVIYYRGMMKFAADKLEESTQNYSKTSRMEELGLKSIADVAQIEVQMAADDYSLTQYENLYNTALITLKEKMNFPYEANLYIDTLTSEFNYIPANESVADIFEYARENNPTAIQYNLRLQSYRYDYKIAKGNFLPSIYASGSISTNYYKFLNDDTSVPDSFSDQFRNNRGENFSITLSIPIFNRLSTTSTARRARNYVRIAEAQQTEVLQQLQGTIEKKRARPGRLCKRNDPA